MDVDEFVGCLGKSLKCFLKEKGVASQGLRYWQEVAIRKALEELNGIDRKFVLIRLPTGYGKTIIGLAPFLYEVLRGWNVASWLCYSLPMRVLCNSVGEDHREFLRFKRLGYAVEVFHGGEDDAEELFADVAVTTFDTLVASYARRTVGGYHLERPAGFLTTSYLVFDEAHMLNDEYFYSFSILETLLRTFKRVGTPTLIMTATMPDKIFQLLFGAPEGSRGVVCIPETLDEFKEQPREYRGEISEVNYLKEKRLPSFIERLDGDWKRLLVVTNTVERAINTFESLKVADGTLKLLLHAKLIRSERARREVLARAFMRPSNKCSQEGCRARITGPPYNYVEKQEGEKYKVEVLCDDCASREKQVRRLERVAVIATQVVEAGLNISSDTLVTEVASADSLVQRCGRCSRFHGETGGKVYIIGIESPAPYPKELVNGTINALGGQDISPRLLMNFKESIEFVNKAYEGFSPKQMSQELGELLTYLEGRGLSTFTVDWKLIHWVKARPEAQVTLVWMERIPVFPVRREKEGPYHPHGLVELVNPGDLADKLREFEKQKLQLAIDAREVRERSFTLNLEEIRDLVKEHADMLLRIDEKFVELRRARMGESVRGFYVRIYLLHAIGKLREATYLLNTKYYDNMLGMRRR